MNTQFPLGLYGWGRNKNCDLNHIQMIKIPPSSQLYDELLTNERIYILKNGVFVLPIIGNTFQVKKSEKLFLRI
jgi:hypothetical protein